MLQCYCRIWELRTVSAGHILALKHAFYMARNQSIPLDIPLRCFHIGSWLRQYLWAKIDASIGRVGRSLRNAFSMAEGDWRCQWRCFRWYASVDDTNAHTKSDNSLGATFTEYTDLLYTHKTVETPKSSLLVNEMVAGYWTPESSCRAIRLFARSALNVLYGSTVARKGIGTTIGWPTLVLLLLSCLKTQIE